MTAPAPQDNSTDPTQLAARTADLAELLGHLTHCWDDERRQLARKLHDNLGSSLTALTMHLSLLAQRLPPEKPLQDRMAQMKQLLMQVVEANRKMQLNLWNDKLEFLGVKAALSELVAEFGAAHPELGCSASLPDEDIAVSRDQGVAMLRVAEEGLRNAAQHARAGTVELIVDDNEDEAMVTVRDNGRGHAQLDRQAGGPPCHGLRLLRERVSFLGGTLTVGDHPEGGTALTAVFPKSLPD
jgi:signal transduction histidine kinase